MNTEILRIIEGGLSGDKKKIITYSKRLAERLSSEGNISLAKCIIDKIDTSMPKTEIIADAMRTIPLDQDSRLQIVEVIPSNSKRQKIVLSSFVQKEVTEFIELIKHSSDLELAGLEIKKSLLLYGPPGCGKTSIANYICEKTQLPLVIARLDGIVSSLLGSTAKNLRKIFEYAESFPCILFLDEFDAIAKARDDAHELGELKRVINSLLQNIDAMPTSCVLIAATNHQELLDKAVWRRFVQKIDVGLPSEKEIEQLIKIFSESYRTNYLDEKQKMQELTNAFLGMSPSDIKTIFDKVKVKNVISKKKTIDYLQLMIEIFDQKNDDKDEISLVRFLNDNGVSQINIHDYLGLSLRKIKTYLSKNN